MYCRVVSIYSLETYLLYVSMKDIDIGHLNEKKALKIGYLYYLVIHI